MSRNQRIAAAIAEHHPEELYDRNKGMAKMSQSQLHDFAATPEKGLPKIKAPKVPSLVGRYRSPRMPK